jgi:hypothetical protein
MLTTGGIRCVGVPIVLILEWVVNTVLQKENLATYYDIEKSPVRNTYPRRDRVWEPAGQLQCQTQDSESLLPQGTHDEGGRVVLHVSAHLVQLMTDI